MNGKQIVFRNAFGFFEIKFLNEYEYSIKYKIKGSYRYIAKGEKKIMYFKDYYGREEGVYLEYRDARDTIIGLAFTMIEDIARDGLKNVYYGDY